MNEIKKKKDKKEKQSRERNVIREYFELIAETAIFVFFVMTFVVQAFQIPTGSMESTLLIGDFLLVNKMSYAKPYFGWEKFILPRKDLERKDIIVFKYPKELQKDFVKRVVALEGDKLEIKDKQVYINDVPIDEDYKVHVDDQIIKNSDYYQYDDAIRDNFGPFTVPAGHVFAMGDNRDNSMDSRYWGPLPVSYIKGRPWLIYFSYDAEKDAYLRTSLRDRLEKFARFIPKARWKRLLKIIH
ncbi:MAG: signal peptidase I [Candidatus Aminicenantes bacterium]|nr:signal peptidase I [Candidatus Aminicenantes bacterium]